MTNIEQTNTLALSQTDGDKKNFALLLPITKVLGFISLFMLATTFSNVFVFWMSWDQFFVSFVSTFVLGSIFALALSQLIELNNPKENVDAQEETKSKAVYPIACPYN